MGLDGVKLVALPSHVEVGDTRVGSKVDLSPIHRFVTGVPEAVGIVRRLGKPCPLNSRAISPRLNFDRPENRAVVLTLGLLDANSALRVHQAPLLRPDDDDLAATLVIREEYLSGLAELACEPGPNVLGPRGAEHPDLGVEQVPVWHFARHVRGVARVLPERVVARQKCRRPEEGPLCAFAQGEKEIFHHNLSKNGSAVPNVYS